MMKENPYYEQVQSPWNLLKEAESENFRPTGKFPMQYNEEPQTFHLNSVIHNILFELSLHKHTLLLPLFWGHVL